MADTYVQGGTSANVNFGHDVQLLAKNNGVYNDSLYRESYLAFELSPFSGKQIISAKLRLYGASTGAFAEPVSTYSPRYTSIFEEYTLTFNTRPGPHALLSSLSVTPTYKYWEWDVVSYVKDWLAVYTGPAVPHLQLLVMEDSGNVKVVFNSREARSNRPQLVIVAQ